MKKVYLPLLVFCLTCNRGHCDTPSLRLQLKTDKTEIFTTEFPTYTVEITNTGTTDVQIIDTDYKDAGGQWIVDNPRVALADPVYIGDRWQSQGQHHLKMGESYTDHPKIYFPERISNRSWESSIPKPITLRVGFKVASAAKPVWSNPVTIKFRRYEDLLTKTKVEFEEINPDGRCFPIAVHMKELYPFAQPPIIAGNLVINDEQSYEQFLKLRPTVIDRVCDQQAAYKHCMATACRAVENDEKKRLQCAENLCRTSVPSEVKGCEVVRKTEQECLNKQLPPVDFSQKTVLGQATSGTCGTTDFKREVFKDDKTKTITYFVTNIDTIGACMGPGHSSMNLISVPKIPPDYKVVFSYKFP